MENEIVKEISLEQAKDVADQYLKGISHCVEYSDAFWFSNEKSNLSLDGVESPVIILKGNGRAVSAAAYVAAGAGKMIREIEYRKC